MRLKAIYYLYLRCPYRRRGEGGGSSQGTIFVTTKRISMKQRKIKWVLKLGPDWQWLGVDGKGTVPPGDIEGSVTLPPNRDYWFSCLPLVLQGVAMGFTGVRYWQDSQGNDMIQGMSESRGDGKTTWVSYGQEGSDFSTSGDRGEKGGINLRVSFEK